MKKILAFLLLALPIAAHADYRIIPYGKQYVFDFTLRDADATALTSGLTLTAGDCKISKAGGADNNCATLPTAISSSNKYLFTLASAEATTSRVIVMLNDTTGTAYYGREFTFDTCGNSAARFPVCPFNSPLVVYQGTCGSGSTNAGCRDATLTQAAGYWNNFLAIQVGDPGSTSAMPPRCVRAFDATNHELQWPGQPVLPATSLSQPYSLIVDLSCRQPP